MSLKLGTYLSFLPFTLHIESSPLHLQLGKSRLVTQFEMPNFSIITNRITNSDKDRYFYFGGGWSGYKKVAHTGYHRIVNIHINSDSFELRLSPQLLHFSVLLAKCAGYRPIFIWCMKIIPETMRKFATFNTVVALD